MMLFKNIILQKAKMATWEFEYFLADPAGRAFPSSHGRFPTLEMLSFPRQWQRSGKMPPVAPLLPIQHSLDRGMF